MIPIQNVYYMLSYAFQVLNEQGSAPFPSGPLTLIFKKADIVPYATSGGLETVAIRFPEIRLLIYLLKPQKCQ